MGPGGPEYYHDYHYYAWPGGPETQATKRGQAKPGTTTYYHDYGYYAWPGGWKRRRRNVGRHSLAPQPIIMIKCFGMQFCPCSFNITVDTHTPVRIIRTRRVGGGKQSDLIQRSSRTSQQVNGHGIEGRAGERQRDCTKRSNRTGRQVTGHR